METINNEKTEAKTKLRYEVALWVVISGLVSGRLWFGFILWYYRAGEFNLPYNNNVRRIDVLVEYLYKLYPEFIFGCLVFVFPFLFKSIYGQYPFSFERFRSTQKKISKKEIADFLSSSKESDMLSGLILDAKEVSEAIYRRSNIYLLIGSLIALVGIIYFSTKAIATDDELSKIWPQYLQHTSELIIIELVAFFFLRQYRINMDEYKYYESLKRNRENHLLIYKIIKGELLAGDKESYFSKSNLFNEPGRLSKDETTELLETKKIPNDELNVLNKFLETLKDLKKNDSAQQWFGVSRAGRWSNQQQIVN